MGIIMNKILQDFLKACMGMTIFCSVGIAGTEKAGCEGILQDYDEENILLKGKVGIMVIPQKNILTYECIYAVLIQ